MKKIICAVFCALFIMSALSGCGNTDTTSSRGSSTNNSSAVSDIEDSSIEMGGATDGTDDASGGTGDISSNAGGGMIDEASSFVSSAMQ